MILLTPRRRYLVVWISLLLLLVLTSVVAHINLGWGNTALSMGIATIKALLIAIFFMHVLRGDSALRLTIMLPIFLFFLLTFLGLADFLSRESHPAPWRAPAQMEGRLEFTQESVCVMVSATCQPVLTAANTELRLRCELV